ncbi:MULTISPECIES: metallophosphoesterase [Haloferax]|uniref:Calcineurin-like phosphoesterase domain-containing protein n=2 Tax=Haloferax TaxID=2251 RepID=A0A6G1Z7J2_9EURY|nr:hypothetical protein Hfx1149_17270 [Haloferax sp. CBA1149]MRW82445.1 hypothetical protein [Haloferax marinisediminis]
MNCPVAGCDYRGPVASVAGHISGKRDTQHSWSRLGYDGANHFKRVQNSSERDLPRGHVRCPVSKCNYTGEISSVAAHVSGKRDKRHDWNRIGYRGAVDYKNKTGSQTASDDTVVLQMTDSHLGKTNAGSKRYKRTVDCVPGFKRAIEFAVAKDVDAVFHSGDLFHNDRHGISESLSSTCRKQLSYLRSANIPFYYILGNHERKEGTEILKTYERDGLATHLSTTPTKVGKHLDLYGVDFTRQSEWEAALLKGSPSNNQYSILTLHQSVQPYSLSDRAIGTVNDVLRWAREYCGVNFDVLALGHLHKQIEEDTDGCTVVCGGSTAPIGYKKSALSPSVGLFSASSSGLSYQRHHLKSSLK